MNDWLIDFIGGNLSDLVNIDGMDLWSSLSENNASPRNLMLHNIDTGRNIEALRMGDWKMVNGKKISSSLNYDSF